MPSWHNGTASASKAEPFGYPGSIPGEGVIFQIIPTNAEASSFEGVSKPF